MRRLALLAATAALAGCAAGGPGGGIGDPEAPTFDELQAELAALSGEWLDPNGNPLEPAATVPASGGATFGGPVTLAVQGVEGRQVPEIAGEMTLAVDFGAQSIAGGVTNLVTEFGAVTGPDGAGALALADGRIEPPTNDSGPGIAGTLSGDLEVPVQVEEPDDSAFVDLSIDARVGGLFLGEPGGGAGAGAMDGFVAGGACTGPPFLQDCGTVTGGFILVER